MKLILILIILFSGANITCFAQSDSLIYVKSSDTICKPSPDFPSFPGGIEKLYLFINQHFQDSLIQPGTFGRIFIQMTVDTSGTLNSIKVLHGINDVLDKEMLRVFSLMPKWIPAVKNDEKVEAEFVIPIKIDFKNVKN